MKKFINSILLVVLFVVSVQAQEPEKNQPDKKPVLVVMDLKALAGISTQESTSITGFIRTAVKKTQKYQLINREDLESIAKNYKIELAICDTDACLLKIGMLSGAQKLVAGDIGVVSGKVIINVRMVDVASDSLVNEFVCSRTCAKDADVIQQTMNSIVQELCFGSVVNPYSNVDLRKPLQTNEIIGKDGAEMVLISAGEFMMGSPEGQGEDDEHPQHTVYLDAFYIDKYEVTNELFAKFLNAYGKDEDNDGEKMIYDHKWGVKKIKGKWYSVQEYEKYPVIYVTWYGANQYAKFYGKRLPTEAEWEKACNAGVSGKYCFGNDDYQLAEYAWFGTEVGFFGTEGHTHPVGTRKPNVWGIYDMHGNVREWCADRYYDRYYLKSPSKNPKGPDKGTGHISRGGGWWSNTFECRSTYRTFKYHNECSKSLGFRCAQDVGK